MNVPSPSVAARAKQYTIRDLTPLLGELPPFLLLAPLLLLLVYAAGAGAAEPPATRSVAVKVVDRIGRPVKDVSACLVPACAKVAWRAEKDAYLAEVPAAEAPVALRLTAKSYEPAEVTVKPEAGSVEATLKAKGSVKVVFVASDEKRAERLTVSLKETVDPKAGTRGRLLAEKTLDLEPRPAQNAVALEDVPPGDWVLWWEGPSLAAGTKVVKVGETRADAGSVAVVAGRSVEGAVRDDLGMVVAGARVRLRAGGSPMARPLGTDRSARTGSDGSFAVHGLPLDEVLAWGVTAAGHETARGTLGGETRLEVVVTRAQRVFGRLVDEEGRPVSRAPIEVSYTRTVESKDSEGRESRHTTVEGHTERVVSGEDGAFSFFRQLPFATQLAPENEGFLPDPLVLPALAEDEARGERDLGDVVLRKGRTLTGRVATVDGGEPVEGATLEATWTKEERGSIGRERGVSGADGSFRIEGILPGREVVLTAKKEGFAPRTVRVSPEADSVDVLLGKGGRVRGRVCGTAWELPSIAVWYGAGTGISNQNQVRLDASGRFVLENAEAGQLTFARSWRFQDPARPGSTYEWSGRVRATVGVREDETSEVSLGCDGILVSGAVTRGGRPVASQIVSFSLGGGDMTDALLDANGAFVARVSAPGRWLLSALGSPLQAAAGCDVPPGGLEGCRVELAPGTAESP
jgi:hypothetical protein